jgi:hypothetical protein
MSNTADTNSPDTNNTQTFSRPLRIEDFLEVTNDTTKNKHNKYNKNNERIEKNQQEFGHKKRIKP